MSDIVLNVALPLDDEKFFRRACPFCHKEFKILVEDEELQDFVQSGINSFLLEQEPDEIDPEIEESEEETYTCPYCGQNAPQSDWWTDEQMAYFEVFAHNIMAKIINEQFIGSLENSFKGSGSGFISLEFKGNKIEQQEPWISPEENDLEVFELLCCERKIKIDENPDQETVYCFFCGFPHKVTR